MGVISFLNGLLGDPAKHQIGDGWLEDEFQEAVEQVAQLVYPKVRWASLYRKKLRPAVERTLEYAVEVAQDIPGPVELNLDSWGKDALPRFLFVGVDEYRDFLQNNKGLERFFRTTATDQCFAFLTMSKEEKRFLGVDSENGILKRDVPQLAIHFAEHRIVAPMASEKESKKAAALQILTVLATHSLEEMLSLIAWQEELEEQKKILEIKLKIHSAKERGLASILSGTYNRDPKTAEASQILDELNQKISTLKAKFDGPEDYLKYVTDMLSHPEDYLTSESQKLRLTDMGIKMPLSSSKGREVHLAELHLKGGLKRAAVFIRYPHEVATL
ncbi:MAG: hypothetical protein JRF64_01625 [Deltaproteobacteria bacterium]|nr:hypothetical protein [Deltaproteobacteria bacterium]